AALIVSLQDALGGTTPTASELQTELARRDAMGLRYVGVVSSDGQRVAVDAGESVFPLHAMRTHEVEMQGGRARFIAPLPPPPGRGRHRVLPPQAGDDGGPPDTSFLAIEYDPPRYHRLRTYLGTTAVVGGIAIVVLVGFAIALARSTSRLVSLQEQGE